MSMLPAKASSNMTFAHIVSLHGLDGMAGQWSLTLSFAEEVQLSSPRCVLLENVKAAGECISAGQHLGITGQKIVREWLKVSTLFEIIVAGVLLES